MASEDFEKLMNLIYFEEYKVSKLSLRVRGEEAIAEVILTKGSDEIIRLFGNSRCTYFLDKSSK